MRPTLFAVGVGFWSVVLGGWFVLGGAYAMSVTHSGRLLRRSANAEDRPTVFAAQFALSHGAWLICYPIAGQVGALSGRRRHLRRSRASRGLEQLRRLRFGLPTIFKCWCIATMTYRPTIHTFVKRTGLASRRTIS